jgi:alpha-tubulin suppressor-like RCC1 family protein
MVLLPVAVGAMTLTGCVADPAPQMVGVVAGDHSATVTWQAPLGIPFPIVAYVVTPLINNVAQTPTRFDSTATTETVTGLTNGTRYTFAVKAINALGNDSASSVESGVVTPPGITAVSTGGEHTCGLTSDGVVYCWGRNDQGELGDSTTIESHTPVETKLAPFKASQVAVGSAFACAVVPPGTVFCWGDNSLGELGDGTGVSSAVPSIVSFTSTATAIAAGDSHACAVFADGTVQCWGSNQYGQLGNGTTTNSLSPVTVAGITTATAITAGFGHTCALLAGGTIKCWGLANWGQLGDGTTTNSSTPVTVTGITTATAVSAGYVDTCALLAGGIVKCWGSNIYGELGYYNGNNHSDAPGTPVQIDANLRTATAISAGYSHNCVVADNHGAWCWGLNDHGQLGDGTLNNSGNSVEVAGISTATAVGGGDDDSCAVVASGVKCWGVNVYGEIGNGTTNDTSTPVAVVWP